jgi:hypothetical protein
MKIVELVNNIQIPITNDESDLLARFDSDTPIAKNQLTEHEQVLANQLTIKNILLRTNTDGKIYYKKTIK